MVEEKQVGAYFAPSPPPQGKIGLNIGQFGYLVQKKDFMFILSYCISANTSDTSSLIEQTATRQWRAMRLS